MRVFYKPRKNGTYLYIKTFSNKQQNYAEQRKKGGEWVRERERLREREGQKKRNREGENEKKKKKSDGEFKKK